MFDFGSILLGFGMGALVMYVMIFRIDGTPRYRAERDRALGRISALQEALQWCGGSQDFAPDGKAREGWLKIQHLLD